MGKKKYDADYISYVEHGDSAAVFVTRDIVKAIDTSGKWIDVLYLEGNKNKDNKWDFKYFIVELFPRKKHAEYPKNASDEDKKYITWETACEDIEEQRAQGYRGRKYRINPKLVDRNKGKYRQVPYKPKWDYDILSIKRL